MKRGPSLNGLRTYGCRCLGLQDYLKAPGDGRTFPQIPASSLLWALIASKVLRVYAFSGTEQLVHTVARAFGVQRAFGDDALAYFTERLPPARLRAALQEVLWRARRNKAFERSPRVGLALDGSGVGRSRHERCALCHPHKNAQEQVNGYGHKMVGASVVSATLCLPLDVEFHRVGENELTAAKRLLERVVRGCRTTFDYVVVDGLYPGIPFLHLLDRFGLPAVARLTEKLPELFQAATARFANRPPTACFSENGESIEIWDADDFEPWEGLNWPTVRVIRYRQHRRNGEVCQALWLTNFSPRRVGSLALYRLCKSRWQIENRFFNEGKNLYGLAHIPHHHANAVLIHTLLTCLALCLERLYRLRHLHRGTRPAYTAVCLVRLLWIALGHARPYDTS